MTIDDLCAKMGAMYAQLSRLEQGERGGVRRSLVQHMLEDSAVMRYIIGRLSPEQRREADKFLSNHAEYIAGNTMDEKVSGLEERKYKIRIWEKVTETK